MLMFKPTGDMRWLCDKAVYPTVEDIARVRDTLGCGIVEAKQKLTVPATKILQMQVKDDNGICSWINVPEVYENAQ